MALNDIEIYQLIRTAFALCDEVGTALKARREFNLADQLLRAALSVGNNFAGGLWTKRYWRAPNAHVLRRRFRTRMQELFEFCCRSEHYRSWKSSRA
ncbi:MAG: four helix bundle protein [Ignavibacteria bacterium]|nr:four helix bundle protein [Ignavibacteria bacterium]